jgi:DNA-binding XRE family transcriptional regulator
MKPWEEFANAMEESQRQEEIERTADCTQRHLYELIHKHAFKEVREILRHTHEYMAETIEVLEEREQPSGFRATPHRHSA